MQFLRHSVALVLALAGTCLALFSYVIAFGWGHRTLSVAATAFAVFGYGMVFAGFWLLRDSDWEPLASAWLRGLLLLGSVLLLVSLIAVVIHVQRDSFPFGYFTTTGCLSSVGYWQFRRYAVD
jgi:hypothetical protein